MASSRPPRSSQAAAAVGVRLLALTDHDTLAGYREVIAAGAVPPGLTLIPGVEINAIVTRDLGLWEGELHILGFGMDPDDEAFEATLAAQRRRRRERFEQDGRAAARARPADRRPARPAVGLRRRRARPPDRRPGADRGRPRDDRRGCLPAAARLGDAGVRAAQRPRPGRGDRGDPGRRRAPGRWPISARRRRGSRSSASWPMPASAGSRSTTARSTRPRSSRSARSRRRSVSCRPAGSDYHGDTGTYAEAHAGLWVPPEVAAGIPAPGSV